MDADVETLTQGQAYALNLFLEDNGIEMFEFLKVTYEHFTGQAGKKNNLFFMGMPSTGKTMIMESLVRLHYNFSRLTGLTPGSSFNFSSLLHTNACFMDECKLTDNQFEQWKLLASGSPMATDIKYRERHNITNCRLYTCSNYPINMYTMVPESANAIETRTTTFVFTKVIRDYIKLSSFTWQYMWDAAGFKI